MSLKAELHKNKSPDNSKEHHGIQICNTFQEPFDYKEATFKGTYLAWSTSDARNYTLVNEIWTPDPNIPSSQDILADNLLYQSRDKKITASSSAYGFENGNIADFLCILVREQASFCFFRDLYLFSEPPNNLCFDKDLQGQLSKCNRRNTVIALRTLVKSHKGLQDAESFAKSCSS